jgi:hypothetical protein
MNNDGKSGVQTINVNLYLFFCARLERLLFGVPAASSGNSAIGGIEETELEFRVRRLDRSVEAGVRIGAKA